MSSSLGSLCILPIPNEASLYAFPDDTASTPVPKLLCSASSCYKCGNAIVEGLESCDDGVNTGAGCLACVMQSGYECLSNGACSPLPFCGDGIFTPSNNETCDDGNFNEGDGCDPLCVLVSCCRLLVEHVLIHCDCVLCLCL